LLLSEIFASTERTLSIYSGAQPGTEPWIRTTLKGKYDDFRNEKSSRSRILAIDAMRAIALAAMALDHAAASVGVSLQAETYGGQAAILASWPYWVTGLFTNLAAPTFWLLSGASIALFAAGDAARVSEWGITRQH
jgi:uncharacterized membrane protein